MQSVAIDSISGVNSRNIEVVGDKLAVVIPISKNAKINGDLDLRGTPITQLPDNLSVSGSLLLRDTSITQLPDNLSVGGDLDLRGTQITTVPKDAKIGGKVYS